MFQELQDQVQGRADLLLAGRFEDMSREYLFPLPVYLDDRLIALRDASDGIDRAAALRDLFDRRQVQSLIITVRAVEMPRDGRFRVWADWHAVSRDRRRSKMLGLTYFMRDTGQGIRSEMLHYQTKGLQGSRSAALIAQRA